MDDTLRDTIVRGWPLWNGTLHASSDYAHYDQEKKNTLQPQPQPLIDNLVICRATIRRKTNFHKDDLRVADIVKADLREALVRAVYGSNMLAGAGFEDRDLTMRLCGRALSGALSVDEEVAGVFPPDPRACLEVVQHARAFGHLVGEFSVRGRDLTEGLILETHEMLFRGVTLVRDGKPMVSSRDYAGAYRPVSENQDESADVTPRHRMRRACEELQASLREGEEDGRMDPFSVAARFSLELARMRPFRDGNGRMARMILNAILCRYVGVIAPMGETGLERVEFRGILARAGGVRGGHGELAWFTLEKVVSWSRNLEGKIVAR
ncbi:hypothetical protein ACHAQA_007317 [Verticillium albo-atrum]